MPDPASTSTLRHRPVKRVTLALLACLMLASASPAAAAHPVPATNASVITTWNQIAVSTVTATGPSPTAFNYFAFTHLAMYNAVVGITGGFELYKWDVVGSKKASPEAAAAAAAHRVLKNYFPAQATTLDESLAASLARVRNPVARKKGIAYGVLAANRIIALRTNDGRNAAVTVPTGTTPGHWRPEPATALFTSAWLGGVTPLAIDSATQFAPGAPPAISTPTYLEEFNEVRDYGGQNADTLRTAEQSQTARFYSDAGIVPMQAGLREFATRRKLDIVVRCRGHQHRRRGDHGLARQAPVHVVAADHGHPQRRYGRERSDRRKRDMDAVHRDASVPGLAERPVLGGGCGQHDADSPQRRWHARSECHVCSRGRDPALRHQGADSRGGRQCPSLVRDPLPDRGRGVDRHRLERRGLGPGPLLPTDRLTRVTRTPGGHRGPPAVFR
jgi:hypothetical protein